MTHCEKMLIAVEKRVEEGKSAKEIGEDLCDIVVDKKRKAKYLIDLLAAKKGVEYKDYVEAHPTLGLQPQKARKTKPKKNDKASDENSSDIEEPPEEKAEDEEIQIGIKPIVQKRLDYIMKNYSTEIGEPIDSYNKAIRFALRKAELWDILE